MECFQYFHTILRFSYFKLNFKLEIDQKCVLFKTWKKLGKPRKNFEKTSGNPVFIESAVRKNRFLFRC